MNIIYLEAKELTRTANIMLIEKQKDCKVEFSTACPQSLMAYMKSKRLPPDVCILSDAYPYTTLTKTIKSIKLNNKHTYILLQSDAKYMKGICMLLKNGLHGFYFTDEPMIDLNKCVYQKTKFKLTLDKLNLITKNLQGHFQIKELQYNTTPLTINEIAFIQACTQDESYEEIAIRLQKTISTIYGYRDRVFKKLQVKQRTAMVMTALKRNYIDL